MSKLSKAYNLSQSLVTEFGLKATIKRFSQTVDDFGELTQETLTTVYTDLPVVIKERRLPPPDLTQNKIEFKSYYDAIFNFKTTTGTEVVLKNNDVIEIEGSIYTLLNVVKEPFGWKALLVLEQ